MWSQTARDLVSMMSSAVVYVEIVDSKGDKAIGTAFHIGEGYFVSARHVLEQKILGIGRRDTSKCSHTMPDGAVAYTTTHPDFVHKDFEAVFYHPNDAVDVGILKVGGKVGNVPAPDMQPLVQLCPYPDAPTEGEFLMEEVIVLGYPPIPTSLASHIVAFRGEVSAVIESYQDKKRHFVISGMARGGFSGGPVVMVTNPSFVLGVVGRSLLKAEDSKTQNASADLGFIGAVSVGAVFETLEAHGQVVSAVQATLKNFVLPPIWKK